MPEEPKNEVPIIGMKAIAAAKGVSVSTIRRWRNKYPDFPVYQELKKPKRRVCQGCKAYMPVEEPHEDGPNVCAFDADDKCYWIAEPRTESNVGKLEEVEFVADDEKNIRAMILGPNPSGDSMLIFVNADNIEDVIGTPIKDVYRRYSKEG